MALKSFREDPRRARHEKLVAPKQIPVVVAAKSEPKKVSVPVPTQNPTQIPDKELKIKKEMA